MSYMYRSKPEILRLKRIPPFIFPLQSLQSSIFERCLFVANFFNFRQHKGMWSFLFLICSPLRCSLLILIQGNCSVTSPQSGFTFDLRKIENTIFFHKEISFLIFLLGFYFLLNLIFVKVFRKKCNKKMLYSDNQKTVEQKDDI